MPGRSGDIDVDLRHRIVHRQHRPTIRHPLFRFAGRSGFITALYIVMTPLLAFLILRRRVTMNVIVSVAIAVVGFYLLCITDGFGWIHLCRRGAVVHCGSIRRPYSRHRHVRTEDRFPDSAVLRTNFRHRAAELDRLPYAKAPSTGPAPCKAGFHRVRRHRLGRRGIYVAGGRTAAGAAVARGRDHARSNRSSPRWARSVVCSAKS